MKIKMDGWKIVLEAESMNDSNSLLNLLGDRIEKSSLAWPTDAEMDAALAVDEVKPKKPKKAKRYKKRSKKYRHSEAGLLKHSEGTPVAIKKII